MITRCPHCQTRFGVQAEHLDLAAGQVQCGRCFNMFDARQALEEPATDNEAAENDTPVPEPSEDPEFIPLLRPSIAEIPSADEPGPEATEETETPEPAWATPDDVASAPAREPSWEDFAEDEPGQTGTRTINLRHEWPWLLGSAALSAVLLFQALRSPGLGYVREHPGSWLAYPVCAVASCELPARRDLAAVRLLARDVREHPVYQDALLINATLENAADFAQPYPLVEVRLANNRNQILGQRAFRPEEYLDAAADPAAGMRPGLPVHLRLEVAIRSDEVSNFEFNFY
jgi:predicted Zn finger-like uncharacterized protein